MANDQCSVRVQVNELNITLYLLYQWVIVFKTLQSSNSIIPIYFTRNDIAAHVYEMVGHMKNRKTLILIVLHKTRIAFKNDKSNSKMILGLGLIQLYIQGTIAPSRFSLFICTFLSSLFTILWFLYSTCFRYIHKKNT